MKQNEIKEAIEVIGTLASIRGIEIEKISNNQVFFTWHSIDKIVSQWLLDKGFLFRMRRLSEIVSEPYTPGWVLFKKDYVDWVPDEFCYNCGPLGKERTPSYKEAYDEYVFKKAESFTKRLEELKEKERKKKAVEEIEKKVMKEYIKKYNSTPKFEWLPS